MIGYVVEAQERVLGLWHADVLSQSTEDTGFVRAYRVHSSYAEAQAAVENMVAVGWYRERLRVAPLYDDASMVSEGYAR